MVCLKRWGANGHGDTSKEIETRESGFGGVSLLDHL